MARKILLADDSVTAQNMGRKILADAGYEVIAVNNGSAALKKIAELKPDLVILDVYMPGYSGLEVCQRLKESPETARIPVLLTVGKLEPFKPEEAQRVRAEGFIVKPFEASELLSTLSKLEDKVVPRAEPSKPGRFARAIAAAEESGRSGGDESASADSGWKSRIGFPKKKTEPEEKVADEAPVQSPINRDLSTGVETPLEKAAEKIFKVEGPRQQSAEASGTSVDVAALAPAGLPKDVTPEEVAAIAAAAAQMQIAASAIKEQHQASETPKAKTTTEASLEPAPSRAEANLPSSQEVPDSAAVEIAAKTATLAEGKPASAAGEPAAAQIYRRRKDDVRPEDTQDLPATMAATAESVVAASPGASRWTAVSVALEGSESAISLDQEMQKAYAASAAADAAGISSARTEAAVEVPAAISNPQPEPVRESEPVVSAVPAETAPAPVAQPEAAVVASSVAAEPVTPSEPARASSQQPESVGPTPIPAEVAPVEFASSNPEPVAQFGALAVDGEVAKPAASAAQDLQSPPEVEPATRTTASTSAFAPEIPQSQEVAEAAAELKLDPETVKNTAAAWASWRETRDTSKGDDAAEAQPTESVPESAPAEAARAVAAGAEQALQEAAAAASEGEQSNVASIVDSVLADLRPKLMEEINRKMSKKK